MVNIMGIFSGIFKSRDAPTNRTAGSAYSFFLGQSASGKRVNERSAMQTSAVYACVRVISESVDVKPEQVRIIIHEMPKAHFGIGGVLALDLGR